MRVLIISAAFPPMQAGEATNTFYLCQHLADRNLDVHVLTSQRNPAIRHPRIKVHSIMRSWSWVEVPRFVKFLRRCSPDAVLLMYIGSIYDYHPMITFAPTISKSVLPHVPFVTRFEQIYGANPSRTSLLARVLRKCIAEWSSGGSVHYSLGTLLRDSDRIIGLSDHHLAMLAESFPGVTAKSVLIPPSLNMCICPENNGASRQKGREILAVKENDFVIAYLGYIYPTKGVETLLEAFQIVTSQRNNVRLILIGGRVDIEFPDRPSYDLEMYDLSRQLGVDDKVIWTGLFKWDNDEASVYLRASDTCVFPFDKGIKLNRSSFSAAAAHGLPIITTQGETLERAFVHKENVYLCSPKDPKAVAAAIETLMDDGKLRSRLAKGALELSEEWFSWEKAIDRTIATFS